MTREIHAMATRTTYDGNFLDFDGARLYAVIDKGVKVMVKKGN